jgi:hypothetical protein
MARTEQNGAARRRGEFKRDRGLLRPTQGVDAQRRLKTRRRDSTRTKADPFGPTGPRHAYLTRPHD